MKDFIFQVYLQQTSRIANITPMRDDFSSSLIGQNTRISFTNPVQDQRNYEVDIDSDACNNQMGSNDHQSYTSHRSMLNSLSESFTSSSMISSFPGTKGSNRNSTEGNHVIEEDTFTGIQSTLDPIVLVVLAVAICYLLTRRSSENNSLHFIHLPPVANYLDR